MKISFNKNSVVILIVFIIFYTILNEKNDEITIVTKNKDIINNNQENFEERHTEIMVYISGEVINPDVYTVTEDMRVIDVIELAGGTTTDADLTTTNLAEFVYDTQHINIPSKHISNEPTLTFENEEKLKINLNTADKSKLMEVDGIGEATAGYIIEYREEHNGFKSIEELKNVNRIGDKTYEKIKDNFYIE